MLCKKFSLEVFKNKRRKIKYALDLLDRVGTKVPGGQWLRCIPAHTRTTGKFLCDQQIEAFDLLREMQALAEAKLRLIQTQIELKKLEIAQLKLEIQQLG